MINGNFLKYFLFGQKTEMKIFESKIPNKKTKKKKKIAINHKV